MQRKNRANFPCTLHTVIFRLLNIIINNFIMIVKRYFIILVIFSLLVTENYYIEVINEGVVSS